MILLLLAAAAFGGDARRTHANARKSIVTPHRMLRRMTAPRTRENSRSRKLALKKRRLEKAFFGPHGRERSGQHYPPLRPQRQCAINCTGFDEQPERIVPTPPDVAATPCS
jgi:hypothetical protein